ncbi:MAG: DegQ family serine endoprotease [Candidatus Marinimicrobia bacterium]|nr:DegQ family serine endoprotease [Candidatus Neomarinimicrobiota bacterium]
MKKYFLMVLIPLFAVIVQAKLPGAKELSDTFIKAVKKVNSSVVTITSEKLISMEDAPFRHPFGDEFFWRYFDFPQQDLKSTALGSGVIVDAEKGYILTNNHVVENADEITVLLMDQREFEAEIVGRDAKSDLAVLKIDADDLIAVKLGDSDELEVGEWVLAIGSPFSQNLSHTVTAGIVSAKGRSHIIGGIGYEDFIQTDAAINPGNSGGALINLDGKLVGINTAIATGGFNRGNVGVGFAIPINLAKRIMEDLINEGRVIRAWLGVYIQDVDDLLAKSLGLEDREGAVVTQVVDGSPADKAGIKIQDVIVMFNDKKVRDTANLKNMVSSMRPGTRTTVDVVRRKKKKTLRVHLSELPEDDKIAFVPRKTTPKLGLRVESTDSKIAKRFGIDRDEMGVVVVEVHRNSKAAKAGIQTGDIIKRIGSIEVDGVNEFREALDNESVNDTVLLLIKRRGGSLFIPIENR